MTVPVTSSMSPETDMPFLLFTDPLTTTSPPKTLLFVPSNEPETKNVVSVPGNTGNKASFLFAIITDPVTPITELC